MELVVEGEGEGDANGVTISPACGDSTCPPASPPLPPLSELLPLLLLVGLSSCELGVCIEASLSSHRSLL